MKTADEILAIVNDYIEHLPYERKPYSLYEPIMYRCMDDVESKMPERL